MSAKYEVVDKNKVLVTVDVDPAHFEAALEKSFQRNKRKFKINGFRPGKAPRKTVERMYGIAALYDSAFNYVIPDEYEAAVKELGLKPVSEPEYDVKEVEGNTKLIFTAEVFVRPTVKLGEYKGLEIKKISTEVTDEDVDAELKRLAEEDFRMESISDRPAQNGDTVIIDYAGSVDGVAFEGGTADNQSLVLGSGQFIPGFEEQVEGHNIGDEFVVSVTFPEDYHAKELAGKAAEFQVTVHDIKVKVIPEINDDFAAEKSEFDTLEEYKKDLTVKLGEKKEKNAKTSYENELIEKVTANAEVDIPDVMVDNAVENTIESYRRQLTQYGIKFEDYLQMTGTDIETMKADLRPNSEKQVREDLVLEEIAAAESLKPTEEQFEARLKEMAEAYKMDYEEFSKDISDELRSYIEDTLRPRLAIDFLVANAVFTD